MRLTDAGKMKAFNLFFLKLKTESRHFCGKKNYDKAVVIFTAKLFLFQHKQLVIFSKCSSVYVAFVIRCCMDLGVCI